MPAAVNTRRIPKATRRKVWVHTFYLFQPLLQFFALVALLLIFSRCSPLAPSTDKEFAAKVPPTGNAGGLSEAVLLEDAFLKNLKELSTSEMEIMSQEDADLLMQSAPHADHKMEEAGVRTFFEQRSKRGSTNASSRQNVLFLPLDQAQQEIFFNTGAIRVDIAAHLAHSKLKARRAFFQNLRLISENKELGATAILILPTATMDRVQGAFSDLKIQTRISLSVTAEDKAFLEIRRTNENTGDNAALLDAALKEANQLAILLE